MQHNHLHKDSDTCADAVTAGRDAVHTVLYKLLLQQSDAEFSLRHDAGRESVDTRALLADGSSDASWFILLEKVTTGEALL